MSLEFLETGQFKVVLGESFRMKPKKKAQKFFTVKHTNGSDTSVFGKDAKLEKKSDRYQVEMRNTNKPNVIYDAQVTTEEEFNCILIYNEETKTFTLERQSAQINIKNRKLELPNGQSVQSPARAPTPTPPAPAASKPFIHTPPVSAIVKPEPPKPQTPILSTPPLPAATPIVTPPAPPIAPIATPEVKKQEEVQDDAMAVDDFDFDISKDMDAILDSDADEEDKSDSDSGSDVFEEIAAPVALPPPSQPIASPLSLPVTPSLPASPNIPLNLALPTTPQPPQQSKKRKLKMASAPIRHPGIASPLTAASSAAPPPQPSTTMQPNGVNSGSPPKRFKSSSDTSSSSGSDDDEESSSGSESGSTESSSGSGSGSESGSESGSSSDDEDFESLAQDITMSLSKGGPSAPSSPQQMQGRVNTPGVPSPSNFRRSPYESNTSTPTTRPPTQNGTTAAGPMSLRALFKDDEEESLSSSESDDDSD